MRHIGVITACGLSDCRLGARNVKSACKAARICTECDTLKITPSHPTLNAQCSFGTATVPCISRHTSRSVLIHSSVRAGAQLRHAGKRHGARACGSMRPYLTVSASAAHRKCKRPPSLITANRRPSDMAACVPLMRSGLNQQAGIRDR